MLQLHGRPLCARSSNACRPNNALAFCSQDGRPNHPADRRATQQNQNLQDVPTLYDHWASLLALHHRFSLRLRMPPTDGLFSSSTVSPPPHLSDRRERYFNARILPPRVVVGLFVARLARWRPSVSHSHSQALLGTAATKPEKDPFDCESINRAPLLRAC